MRSGLIDLFPKDENRETEVSGFRFFVSGQCHTRAWPFCDMVTVTTKCQMVGLLEKSSKITCKFVDFFLFLQQKKYFLLMNLQLTSTIQMPEHALRRAVIDLCEKVGKPLLKLSSKDYVDNGLGHLVEQFDGQAGLVNIEVFNELQHTITGWPGGKPNADDSTRPERALPYPKRVIVFSPHPDDDVISMGGTIRRLIQQGHDVHIAYETSGNMNSQGTVLLL